MIIFTNQNCEEFKSLYAKVRAEAEVKVKKYFSNKKDRQTYFIFSGSSAIEDDEMDKSFYYAYTQEELNHLIQLFIELHNQNAESEVDKVNTLAEVKEDAHLWEYENCNPDLDELFQRCLNDGMLLEDIDPTPRYLYSMSCFYWDYRKKEMSERLYFKVELTDEEYLYLLTEQLTTRSSMIPNYTFNNLVFKRPELARKISTITDSVIGDGICYNNNPFLVILDEVLSDVDAIAGPNSESEDLYLEIDEKNMFFVSANTYGRKLYISEGGRSNGGNFSTYRKLEDIDADKVMIALEANDYIQMMQKLKDRFHDRTAFDDIKAWFDQSVINYKI